MKKDRPILFPTQRDHLEILSERLCASDLEEISVYNMTPHEVLKDAFNRSDKCWSGFYKEELRAVFGVGAIPEDSNIGCAWFLSTGDHREYTREFLRLSESIVAEMHERYDILMNYVHFDNKRSRKWLEYLGFKPLFGVRNFMGSDKTFIYYQHNKD